MTEPDLALEKVLQMGQSMEQAQHHSSNIEQKPTLSTSETSKQEGLNVLCYHHHSLPAKPFQKNHLKKEKVKTFITGTHICRVRNNILVTIKMNTVTVVPKSTEEMNVDKVKTQHVVNATK